MNELTERLEGALLPERSPTVTQSPVYVTDGGEPVGDGTSSSLSDTDDEVDGERVVGALIEAGVLVTDGDGEELVLGETLRAEWNDAIEKYRELAPEELGARLRALSGMPQVGTDTRNGETWYSFRDEDGSLSGLGVISRPVAIAEIAAFEALSAAVEDEAVRIQAVEPLRMFLSECPVCQVPAIETDTLDCCGGSVNPKQEPRTVLACPECDRSLYTFPA